LIGEVGEKQERLAARSVEALFPVEKAVAED